MYKKELNRLIFEELTISGEVQKETIDVWSKILELLPLISTAKYVDDYQNKTYNNVYYGFYSNTVTVFGEQTMIFINLYNFLTPQAFEENKNSIRYLDASSVTVGKIRWLTIAVPMISGKLIMGDAVKESLQHELEHIFQGVKGSKYITVSDGEYAKALGLLGNSDKQIAGLALIIYLSNLSEQDAYANGLYAYLLNQETPQVKINWDIVKNSDAYIHLMSVKTMLTQLENPDEELIKKCKGYFNSNPQEMLKKGKSVEFRFVRKIGKALTKYHKDIREKYRINEMFSGKIKQNINYFE